MGKLQIITFTHPTHKFNTEKEASTKQQDDANNSRNDLVEFETSIDKVNFTKTNKLTEHKDGYIANR